MDEILFTRAHLESLSTDELIKIADNYGVDIPFGLDRIFIIEELLEIMADDDDQGENPQEKDLVDSGLIESVPLPKQYNITFIEVMVRDPLWIFVFWEVKSQDKEVFEKSPEFDGYCLKVLHANKENEADVIFRVPVRPSDSAWYIGFTPSDQLMSEDGGSPPADSNIKTFNQALNRGAAAEKQILYQVELCVILKGEDNVLVTSNPFKLPEINGFSSGSAKPPPFLDDNSLGFLSGYRDFSVLRSSERSFRNKKNTEGAVHE